MLMGFYRMFYEACSKHIVNHRPDTQSEMELTECPGTLALDHDRHRGNEGSLAD